jgi:hypothetical protein
MSRKVDAIDLIKLYSLGSHNGWNQALDDHFVRLDVSGLARIYYGIQAGMDDLVKNKLNDEKMNVWFLRLQRSIENTMKAILRRKYPNPYDSPAPITESEKSTIEMRWLDIKRKRDHEFELFLKKARY